MKIEIETINLAVQSFVDSFGPSGPVLEVGAFYKEGWAALCDRRRFFPGREYIGCDLKMGPGVDRIEDGQRLSFADRSVGTIVMLEVLEHMPEPHRALAEAARVLADDGVLIASMPFTYRLHGFPNDYWRFTASGMHTQLAAFPQKVVFSIGPHVTPSTVFAVASKGRRDFADCEQRLRTRLHHAFARHKRRHIWMVAEERTRDLLGLLTGRAKVGVDFYEPK